MSNEQIRALKANVSIQHHVVCLDVQEGKSHVRYVPDAEFDTEQQAEAFVLKNCESLYASYGPVTIIKVYTPVIPKAFSQGDDSFRNNAFMF